MTASEPELPFARFAFVGDPAPWYYSPMDRRSRNTLLPPGNNREERQTTGSTPWCGATPCAPLLGWRHTAIFTALAWALFGLLLALTPLNGPSSLDLSVSQAIQSVDFSGLFPAMWAISVAGTAPWVAGTILVAVLVSLLFRRWIEALFIAASPIGEGIDAVVKVLIGRERPSSSLVHVQVSTQLPGFPSGHVFYFLFFYGLLCYMILPNISRPWLRGLAIGFTVTLSIVVGVSRIYLGAHWFTDVIGGYLLGAGLLIPYTQLYAHAQRAIGARRS